MVTDGLSNTMLWSESTSSWISKSGPGALYLDLERAYWNTGSFNTSYCTMWPPNPQRVMNSSSSFAGVEEAGMASSFHPGGVCVGMTDGSVRFIKDSISAWPLDNGSGTEPGKKWIYLDPNYNFAVTPGSQVPVWPALSTRNGGEVVSSDSY
jgi:hypothetical protein